MKDQPSKKGLYVSITGTIFVALCCFTPILVVTLGVLGLSFLTPYLDYILFPTLGLFIIITVISYSKWRRLKDFNSSTKTNINKITIEVTIKAPIEKVWEYWSRPEHIIKWSFANDEWEAPEAKNDLRVGGKFKTRMQAKDGSEGFDFAGIYTVVKKNELIEYDMDDDRHVKVGFAETSEGVKITTVFDPESENPAEMQRQGWQAILGNFKKYVEGN